MFVFWRMRYLSPTSLPGGLQTGPVDTKAIQLQRKKLLAELEEAITTGENGWILVNSLRRGYAYSDEANRQLCFSQEIIERIRVLEEKMPPPCPTCNGQGFCRDFGGMVCPCCRGKGLDTNLDT